MQEIYKDIIGYEWYYKVSNLGNVINKYWEKVRHYFDKWWYLIVYLSKESQKTNKKIHRLVAQAFIPNPENKPQVNHIDWDKTNNHVDNLEWCTSSENMRHLVKMWRHHFQTNHPNRGKKWALCKNSRKVYQYDQWKNLVKIWDSAMDIFRDLWLSQWNITGCCNGKRKTAWWYIWSYDIIKDIE